MIASSTPPKVSQPEQLAQSNDLGWGSLRGALVHLMDAEYVWRVLLETGEHVEWLQPEDFPMSPPCASAGRKNGRLLALYRQFKRRGHGQHYQLRRR